MLRPSYKSGFARYAAESEAPELWRGLVGAWCPFLGPTGLTLHDQSLYRNHGTLTSMDAATDWVATADKWGNAIYALDFDGSNDYVNVGDTAVLDITGELTLSAWIRNDDTSENDNKGIIAKYRGGAVNERSYALAMDFQTNNNSPKAMISVSSNGTFAGAVAVKGGTAIDTSWHHVVGVYKPSTYLKVYLDGKEDGVNTTSIPASLHSGDADLWIGCQYRSDVINDYHFDGFISDARIWNRVLTPNEIMSITVDQAAQFRLRAMPVGKAPAAGGANSATVYLDSGECLELVAGNTLDADSYYTLVYDVDSGVTGVAWSGLGSEATEVAAGDLYIRNDSFAAAVASKGSGRIPLSNPLRIG